MKRCLQCMTAWDDGVRACIECGCEKLSAEAPLIDGRYLFEVELGRGSMGLVVRARDVGLDRPVALKLITPSFAKDPSAVTRFRSEAAALAAIRNEHVVQVYSFGPHLASYFFAMEYVPGPNLEDLIQQHATHAELVPLHRALTILIQTASGLEAVHAAGLVHRDLKPANIVIEEQTGRPVVVDFGLAHRTATVASEIAGTPSYMAPEQTGLAPSNTITAATDVYGLACTAFDLLTNRPPFLGAMEGVVTQHLFVDPPRLSSLRPELSPLDPILARGLAKQPELRYPTAGAFRSALEGASARWLAEERPPPRESARPADPKAPQVLIVDDDESFRRFASRAVQLAYHGAPVEIRTAASGEDALLKARAHIPDVLILDYDMPGLDGIVTLSALRAIPGGTRVRVLVVSAKAGDDERWKFGILGVGTFVQKPVALTMLVEVIVSVTQSDPRAPESTLPRA
jgi:serine/threonine-protein kinase